MPESSPPAQSDLLLWLDAGDDTTTFQDSTGLTAADADLDPLGKWEDKSAAGNDVDQSTSAHRPIRHENSGNPFIRANGTAQYLRRNASLGMYAGGACTVLVAMKGNSGNDDRLISEGNSANSNSIYAIVQSKSNDAADSAVFIRRDSGSTLQGNSSTITPDVFDDATDVIYAVTDDGSNIKGFIDGTETGSTLSYTRSGTMTLNRFSIFALVRNNVVSHYAGDIHGILVYDKVLSSDELTDATSYLSGLQGRDLPGSGGGSTTLSPSLVTNTQSFHAPTVAAGSVTLTTPALSNANTFFAPSVGQGEVTLSPPLLGNTESFHSPSVAVGSVTLTASLYSNTNTFYSPSISNDPSAIRPPLLANTNTHYAPSISTGSVALSPALFANIQTFYTIGIGVAGDEITITGPARASDITLAGPTKANDLTIYGPERAA